MRQKISTDQLTIKHLWQLSARHKWLFAGAWLTLVSNIGSGVVVPYYIGKILGALAQSDTSVNNLILGLAITAAITVVVNYLAFRSLFDLEPRVMADLETESLDVLLRRGAAFHNNRIAGKLVTDVSDYATGFLQLANALFIDILPFIAVVVTGVVLVAVKSPLLAVVLLGMTGLVIVWTMRFRQKMRPYRSQRQVAGKEMIGHIADTVVNNQTVKTFGSEPYEMSRHGELSRTLMLLRIRDWRSMASDGSYRMICLFIFELIFVIVLIAEVPHNPALLATGIFAFSYTVTLTNRLFQIGNMMRQAEEALLQVAPMTETLRGSIEVVDAPGALALNA